MRIFLVFLFTLGLSTAPAMAAPPAATQATAQTQTAAKTVQRPTKPPTTNTAPAAPGLTPVERGWGAFLSIAALTAGVLALCWCTEVLRDGVPDDFVPRLGADDTQAPIRAGYKRCFSLAQTQMTWWFWVVAASFLYIVWMAADFLATGFQGGLTQQALVLLGIGMGTGLGAAIIDQAKNDKAGPLKDLDDAHAALLALPQGDAARPALLKKLNDAAAQLSSDGFLRDVLSDNDGISLHRFQSFAWTAVLGLIFLVHVLMDPSTMPALSTYELALLGITAGTYLGFKIPEK